MREPEWMRRGRELGLHYDDDGGGPSLDDAWPINPWHEDWSERSVTPARAKAAPVVVGGALEFVPPGRQLREWCAGIVRADEDELDAVPKLVAFTASTVMTCSRVHGCSGAWIDRAWMAARIGRSPSTVTRALAALEEADYMRRVLVVGRDGKEGVLIVPGLPESGA